MYSSLCCFVFKCIFGQGVNAQKFLAYNFPTPEENLVAYGREEPPEYKLEKVSYPVLVFFFKSGPFSSDVG